MKFKRIQTDLGPISLLLMDVATNESFVPGGADLVDVFRLQKLINSKVDDEFNKKYDSKFNEKYVDFLNEVKCKSAHEFQSLLKLIYESLNFDQKILRSKYITIEVTVASVGRLSVYVEKSGDVFLFEIQAEDILTEKWLDEIHDSLVATLCERIYNPLEIRIGSPKYGLDSEYEGSSIKRDSS